MAKLTRVVEPVAASEGAGVRIHRVIGTPALTTLDPFLLLDFFGSDNPGEYLAGFPDHPHRGFITITYMLDGRMRHRDSMGNEGVLEPGDVQWMKAASGVIHSEMPEQRDGLMRGFQLWLNLPASEKMSDPGYSDIDAASIPLLDRRGGQVRLIAGQLHDVTGPIVDRHTDLFYADIRLDPGAGWNLDAERGAAGFVVVYAGTAEVDGTALRERQLGVVEPGPLSIVAGGDGAALIVVSGRPLREPVAHYGPFVMNTDAEIRTAMNDYQRGRLVQKRAAQW